MHFLLLAIVSLGTLQLYLAFLLQLRRIDNGNLRVGNSAALNFHADFVGRNFRLNAAVAEPYAVDGLVFNELCLEQRYGMVQWTSRG